MSEEESHPTSAPEGVRFFLLGYGIAFRYGLLGLRRLNEICTTFVKF
jgi:hypothetical protein